MNDENTIRAAIVEWGDAFCNKRLDRLMALYAPDAVIFDAIPPFTSGIDAMRTKVADCFPCFPDRFAFETRDLTVSVGSEMAVAHFIWHFIGLPPGHPAGRHWLRSSVIWRKQADGQWLVVHDHCSAPFDPYSEKAVLSPDAIASEAPPGNPVGWFEIYVQAARAVEAGGQIHKPKMSIGQYGYIALVVDTEGNMIGLHSLQ